MPRTGRRLPGAHIHLPTFSTHGSTLQLVGKEHLRFLQEFCLHTRAEGLPSACANVVLRPGTQRNTFSATETALQLERTKSWGHSRQPCSKPSHSVTRNWGPEACTACPVLVCEPSLLSQLHQPVPNNDLHCIRAPLAFWSTSLLASPPICPLLLFIE